MHSRAMAVVGLVALWGCGASETPAPEKGSAGVADSLPTSPTAPGNGSATAGGPTTPPVRQPPTQEPDVMSVDHILIAVSNRRMPAVKRTPIEARALVDDILAKLEAGADWAELKKQHSDDPPPGGPYTMANTGKPAPPGATPRANMAPAFGDVAFGLAMGEIGLAEHHAATSPFGFHIIKRVALVLPEAAGIYHIFIMWRGLQGAPPSVTRSKEEARALASKVAKLAQAEGADWPALVNEHSDDARSKPSYGWKSVLTKGQLGPKLSAVDDALFALSLGGITDVVESSIGFHVIRRGPTHSTVKASHILISWKGCMKADELITRTKEEARAAATKVLERVRAGEDFAQMARENSDGPSGASGGGLGPPFQRQRMAWPVSDAAFWLEVGGISELVESPFGFHIIKRTK